VPVIVDTALDDFSFRAMTSFAYTHADLSGTHGRSLSCVVDTKLNFTYMMVDRFPADVIFGLDFNLPTGKTKLDNDELALLLDPDLVEISQFGEGFNINPSIGMARVWDSWAAGIGVGYLLRGKYDYSESVLDFDPGDIWSLTGEVLYAVSSKVTAKFYGEMARYGKDRVRGEDYYEESDFMLVGAEMEYYGKNLETSLAVEGIYRGKSKFQETGSGLLTEDRSSYGDEYHVTLSCSYQLRESTILRPQLSYLQVNENDYAQTSPFYIGDRSKISLRVSMLREFRNAFNGEFTLSGYQLDVDRNWYHSDARTYRGIAAVAMVTKRF
jgi:hypothetical protein